MRRGEKGMFLVQAMVLLVLLAVLSGMMVRMNLSRHLGAAKRQSSRQDSHSGLGALAQFQACVAGSDFGRGTCALTAAQSACWSSTVGSSAVSISVSGTAPDCEVTIRAGD